MSWGMTDDVPAIAKALDKAYSKGIILFAAASNHGANISSLAFPARLKNVFCIGAANGMGVPSPFSPPFQGVEKYSALGEAVVGADITVPESQNLSHTTADRRSGTSTATPIAAGIAALMLVYLWGFSEPGEGAGNSFRMRKLFLQMSMASEKSTYRYLAPWELFRPYFDGPRFEGVKARRGISQMLQRSPSTPFTQSF
jgi:Subtilase family